MTPNEQQKALLELGIKLHLPDEGLLFKYTSYDSALKIIKNNSLKFSSPNEFNDPFDMTNSLIDKTFTKEELRKWMMPLLKSNRLEKRQIVKQNQKNPEKILQVFDESLNKMKKNFGICCFSKSSTKTLMWSHYADKHQGICLGFSFFPVVPDINFLIMNVNYVDSIKPLNYFRNRDTTLFYWIFTKSHVWSYEDEVRAIYSDSNGLIKFDKISLKEVNFGVKTTQEEKVAFIKELEKQQYKVSRISFMTIDPQTFDLKENKYLE